LGGDELWGSHGSTLWSLKEEFWSALASLLYPQFTV
jgi:hypothetical protein